MSESHSSISYDTLFDGDLICMQHSKGYRFSIDSVVLAHYLNVQQDARILDLGTGCGVISLILLYRYQTIVREVCGIEIQPGLAELAEQNLQSNRFLKGGRVMCGDIKNIATLVEAESYDKVIFNPPFFLPGAGRKHKIEEANLARHQVLASLQDFLSAATFAVKNRGGVYFIYPAEQICECISSAKSNNLEVKKIQFVYSYPHDSHSARLVLVYCLKNGGTGTEIQPPFYVYSEKNGGYSKEMQNLYKKNTDYDFIRRR